MTTVADEPKDLMEVEPIAPPIRYRGFKRFLKNRASLVSLIFLIIISIVAFIPQILARYPQNDIDLSRRRLTPQGSHIFGTDQLGRDVLTEILHATQVTLRIAIGVGILSTIIGVIIGAFAGYYSKFIDSLLMRATDMFLVVPQLIILALALRKFGSGDMAMVIIISSISWMYTARLVRSQVLSLRTREFIDAAKINGRSSFYIVIRHLIPNSWSVIAVSSALTVAGAILLESTISFLGYGIQPPKTSLGRILFDAKGYATGDYFYLFFIPGLITFLIVLSINFISDGLRDALDPRSEQS